MPTVYVNDKAVEIGTRRLNCVQAAELAGILIPHYCFHPSLSVVASCRMCLVEFGEYKDGKVTMQPKVVPGCQTPVKDGTVIVTGDYAAKRDRSTPLVYDPAYKHGERARRAQADTLEGLLLNHPLDCPVCDKAGECKLQDYSFEFGHGVSRLIDPKNRPANKPHISSKITLFTDRCILCSRCVRFTREISGTAELTVVSRGHHAEIDIFPGRPLENPLAGNVVDLCPVGALASKDFLYSQRVWYMKPVDGVCAGCSTGCSLHVDVNKNIVHRLRARPNPAAQGDFICDEGRASFKHISSVGRLDRATEMVSGKPVALHPELVVGKLRSRIAENPAVIFSPFLTLEEVYLFAHAIREIAPNTLLVEGPTPVVGTDDKYPKNLRGESVEPVKFTIRAEKAPNRRGVATLLSSFGASETYDTVMAKATKVLLLGGPPERELTPELPRTVEVVAAIATHANPWTDSAQLVIPALLPFEKEGTYVNHAGTCQTFPRAIVATPARKTELQIAHELAGGTGLVRPAAVRSAIAARIAEFAGLAVETAPTNRLELTTV